jgi:hypothetical protein
MSLDLNKLENKLDEALSNETSQTLTKFLNDKRMENNKQQTAVEWLIYKLQNPQFDDYIPLNELKQQAKEMEIVGKEMSYADGYKEGYQRALDYMTDTIKNKIEIKENANNEFRKGTANTTHTTFLCTEFVSDQLFYKGTLPHCMRCGKPQYQHPIISNTI